ncbi:MAG: hypothetical protein ACXVGF_04650 [Blastococcus sp.]
MSDEIPASWEVRREELARALERAIDARIQRARDDRADALEAGE